MLLSNRQVYSIISESNRISNAMSGEKARKLVKLRNALKPAFTPIAEKISQIQEEVQEFVRLLEDNEDKQFEIAKKTVEANSKVNALLDEESGLDLNVDEYKIPQDTFDNTEVTVGFIECIEPFFE